MRGKKTHSWPGDRAAENEPGTISAEDEAGPKMAEYEQGAKTADTFTAAAAAMETFRRHMLVTTTVLAPNGPTIHGPQEELKT